MTTALSSMSPSPLPSLAGGRHAVAKAEGDSLEGDSMTLVRRFRLLSRRANRIWLFRYRMFSGCREGGFSLRNPGFPSAAAHQAPGSAHDLDIFFSNELRMADQAAHDAYDDMIHSAEPIIPVDLQNRRWAHDRS